MKKTKLILSSSILSTVALVPAGLGSCATVAASKKSTINSVTIGSFKYDLDEVNLTATLVAPDTTVATPNYNVIPDTVVYSSKTYSVTAIADNAFDCFDSFTKGSITIGANVKTIGQYAFYRCRNITGVTFNNSVTSIGNYAFKKCTNLTGSCTIPECIETIGDGAFEDTKIQYVNPTIDFSKLTSIGVCAFKNCSSLTTIGAFSNIQSIGASAFLGCSSLTGTSSDAITIPESCKYIGAMAFKGCKALSGKCIKFDDGIYWSRKGSVEDDQPMEPSTTDVKINYQNLVLNEYASNNLTKYVPVESIAVGVKNFPASGVYQQGDEDDVELTIEPSNATCKTFVYQSENVDIDENTGHFICDIEDCNFVINVAATDGSGIVGSSASYAVGACPVTSVTFKTEPPSRTYKNKELNLTAQANLHSSVTEEEEIEKYSQLNYEIVQGSDIATFDATTGILNTFGIGTVQLKASSVWYPDRFALATIEVGTTLNIDENGVCSGFYSDAITEQGTLTTSGPIYEEFGNTLKFPAEVKSIAANAFFLNSSDPTKTSYRKMPTCITGLDFSEATSLTTIGDQAFAGIYGAKGSLTGTITLPASVSSIGYECFYEQEYVSAYDFSNCLSLGDIPNSLFGYNAACTTIDLPLQAPNLQKINQFAFVGCSSLTEITIPRYVTTIGKNAFNSTSSLTAINFIDDGSRWEYNGDKYSVTDPATNKTNFKANCALEWTKSASSDVSPTISGSTAKVGAASGVKYSGLLEIPASVQNGEINVPVTEISYDGFKNQTGITSIYFPDSITTIGSSSFYGCTGLTSITLPSNVTTLGTNISSAGYSTSTFAECTGLTTIDLSQTQIKYLPSYCFYNCTGATSLKFPTTLAAPAGDNVIFGYNSFTNLGTASTGVTVEIPALPVDPYYSFESYSWYKANVKTLIVGAAASKIWEAETEIGGDSNEENGMLANCKNLYVPEGTTNVSTYFTSTLGFVKQSSSSLAGYDYYKRS